MAEQLKDFMGILAGFIFLLWIYFISYVKGHNKKEDKPQQIKTYTREEIDNLIIKQQNEAEL